MTDSPKVLDLDAVFKRDSVKIGGKTYELRAPQEFGILDDHKLRKLIVEATSLSAKKTATDAQVAKASKLLRDLATMLVVDLQEEIPDWACVAIFNFWIGNTDTEVPPPLPARKPAARKKTTGESSSRGSKRSTAATRKPGSTSRAGR